MTNKHVLSQFPNIDVRSGGSTFNHIRDIRQDVIKSLALYYYTFADLLELKDAISELLTIIDACQVQLDIVRFIVTQMSYI